MGGALYPESLINVHTEFLRTNILGNTHSVSNRCIYPFLHSVWPDSFCSATQSSRLSLQCADEARATLLSFFNADPDDYTVVFTANATAALKLVGESYPFTPQSTLVLGTDSHNSVRTRYPTAVQFLILIFTPVGPWTPRVFLP